MKIKAFLFYFRASRSTYIGATTHEKAKYRQLYELLLDNVEVDIPIWFAEKAMKKAMNCKTRHSTNMYLRKYRAMLIIKNQLDKIINLK